ncbi:hypothetical protein J6590_023420 [Homalodisca vitripennis]|nr:hypothetical protein J6590_023420 [Homalodisca vitripennis]
MKPTDGRINGPAGSAPGLRLTTAGSLNGHAAPHMRQSDRRSGEPCFWVLRKRVCFVPDIRSHKLKVFLLYRSSERFVAALEGVGSRDLIALMRVLRGTLAITITTTPLDTAPPVQ